MDRGVGGVGFARPRDRLRRRMTGGEFADGRVTAASGSRPGSLRGLARASTEPSGPRGLARARRVPTLLTFDGC